MVGIIDRLQDEPRWYSNFGSLYSLETVLSQGLNVFKHTWCLQIYVIIVSGHEIVEKQISVLSHELRIKIAFVDLLML